MDIESVVQSLIHEPDHFARSCAELRQFPDAVVTDYVDGLKRLVDENWSKDPHTSLYYANLIIGIGCLRRDRRILALGMMARGDTVKLIGRMQEAWDTLELAGDLYQQAEDEVGWARTRIGRLFISPNLNRFDEALAEAEIAREIFHRYQEYERLLRLDLNTGYLFRESGRYQDALEACFRALESAQALGPIGIPYLGPLYVNIGSSYLDLGDFLQSEYYSKEAYQVYLQRNEIVPLVSTQLNLAGLAQLRGHYRQALKLLLSLDHVKPHEIPIEYIQSRRILCQTYLALNRYKEAKDVAQAAIDLCRQGTDVKQELGYLIQSLAISYAELGQLKDAQSALDEAEAIFTFAGAQAWVVNLWLKRGQIAFRQGDFEQALMEARRATAYFNENQQILNYAAARLLEGQAALASGDDVSALAAGQSALASAQKAHAPWLRYSGHVLLGKIAERQNRIPGAVWRYRAAVATLERTQRDLTITLRPDFLQDKLEGLRGLMRLHLANGDREQAFDVLECTKSQVLMNHLSNHEHLHWRKNDVRSEALVAELEQLRAEHHAHYQIAFNSSASTQRTINDVQRERSTKAVADCEVRMRAITEQLYLYSDNSLLGVTAPVRLATIQSYLSAGSLMIEFYNDSQHMWAFVVDQQGLAVYPLPLTVRELNEQIKRFQRKVTSALIACGRTGALSNEANSLTQGIQRELNTLYQGILKPLEHHFLNVERLIIVPYGELHYLPLHLLYDGADYLIQKHEVVVFPSASLLTVDAPERSGGTRILAHSWQGELPQTLSEANMVQGVLGGEMYCEEAARREVLFASPSKVLHIAAHGEYRIDRPDLSFIQLADGQLYTDDLLQHDMGYELVILSACETGRSKVTPGDELIGLGRGFLYAGAGALITSLWRVDDTLTVTLMEYLYRALQQGASKAAALREAQCHLLQDAPHLHPAFWGAFQLVGNPHPLSNI